MSFIRNFFDTHPIYLLGEKSSGVGGKRSIQDFYTIRQECLDSGKLFEDPEFPATDESLFFSKKPSRRVDWRRPSQMCDKPVFFSGGFSRFDIQQGDLGDCWLLAAAANLTHDTKLFLRVVCHDNSFDEKYAGIFHFRFWQFGKWVDVVVDDRLPTRNGQFMYLHSKDRTEFWSALLEKAYAKLNGTYEALDGGTTIEGLEDFTGGVTETYKLKEVPKDFFNTLLKGMDRHSMMGCSVTADPNIVEAAGAKGLIRGHAYSITSIKYVDIETPNKKGKMQLLRIRNPWGTADEWTGAWSDKSPEWKYVPEESKKEIGLTFDSDGEFWMSYNDFLKYFDKVEICNLSPESLTEEREGGVRKHWNTNLYQGEWVAGTSAGGCNNPGNNFFHTNPQYLMRIKEPDEDDEDGLCTVVVALMQKNRRAKQHAPNVHIGFEVYRVVAKDRENKPQQLNFFKTRAPVGSGPDFTNSREVSCRFKLPPGHYLILPSTYKENEEAEFVIRVFSEGANTLEEHDKPVGVGTIDTRIAQDIISKSLTEQPEVERLFKAIAGSEQEIGWEKLKQLLDHFMRDDLVKLAAPATNGSQSKTNGQGGGKVPKAKIQNVQQQTAPPPAPQPQGISKDMCRSMLAMLDADSSGKLGLEEFKALLSDIAKWKAAFKLYDRDHSNSLDTRELRDALASAGYNLNTRVLNALVNHYGSADKTIAFDDFLLSAVKVKTLIEHFKEKDINNTNQAIFSIDEWVATALCT